MPYARETLKSRAGYAIIEIALVEGLDMLIFSKKAFPPFNDYNGPSVVSLNKYIFLLFTIPATPRGLT